MFWETHDFQDFAKRNLENHVSPKKIFCCRRRQKPLLLWARPALSALFFCWAMVVWGQSDIGTTTIPGVWQAMHANPAIFAEHRMVISLPGFHGNISSNSFVWGDLISEVAGGRKQLDPERLIAGLKDRNVLRMQSGLPLFGMAIRGDSWSVSAGIRVRAEASLEFPRTLAELLWRGNAAFIGEDIELGPVLNGSIFNESFIGLAVRPNSNLTIGGRFKLLNGLFNISSPRSSLFLLTAADTYTLLLDAGYQLNTTAALSYSGLDTFGLEQVRPEFSRLWGDHPGVALDLGIRYQNGPLALQASVLDLGWLHWKKDARSLEIDGTFEFKGMDVFQQLLEGTGNTPIGLVDSLEAVYEVRQSRGAYRTWLPVRTFGSATYDFNDFVQGAGTLLVEVEGGNIYAALALGGRLKVGRWANLGVLYGIRHGRVGHIGLNGTLNLGPFQLVAATDHLGGLFAPEKARASNLQLGLNLVFCRLQRQNIILRDTSF